MTSNFSDASNSQLVQQLFTTLVRLRFTGRIDLKSPRYPDNPWQFYFVSGQLLYGTGGRHPVRRWLRHVTPLVHSLKLIRQIDRSHACWEYGTFDVLCKSGSLRSEDATRVIRRILAEVLFDLAQAKQLSYTILKEDLLVPRFASVPTEQVFQLFEQGRAVHQRTHFSLPSLDAVAYIKQPKLLESQLEPQIFKTLQGMINGEESLREIAVRIQQNPLTLLGSLSAHINKGSIVLLDQVDKSLPKQAQEGVAPLIVCIDDSEQICQLMANILEPAGFRYVSISDPIRAFAQMATLKPNLLFLDLVMPGISGYELCVRLRKTLLFADLPIIILTGSDNLLERAKSKVTGATDFLSKPIQSEQQILEMVARHAQQTQKA
jgi:two-component system, chemotaxis family, response regulator PixG